MVKYLISRPIAVMMTTLAVIIIGLIALFKIPISLIPPINVPEIRVSINHPNNTAREIETTVTRILKNQFLQISNLKDIESETRDGFASIKLKFDYGANMDYAFIETNEKIDASINSLPRDIERPKAIKASTSDLPVVNLTVSLGKNYREKEFLELSEFCETILKKRIEQLPDVALTDISGLARPEMSVVPFINKIQALGIDNQKIIDGIKENNFELGDLVIRNGNYQYYFKLSNPLKTINEINDIYINVNGRVFQIKDLAKVSLLPQKDRGLVLANGEKSVVFSIIKQDKARIYSLQESLNKLIESFREEYPELNFKINQDQTKLLKISISNLTSSLLIGGGLAILLTFIFLKDLKSALIIGVSIPLSLILSMFFMFLLKMSINIISLSGLILGVGMMIDNSIIVIDNIFQKQSDGTGLAQACIEGTNEIISPLISSVLTTCSVFLPLVFLKGISSALFLDQALAVTIGLVSSLVVSIFFIPMAFNSLKVNVSLFKKRGAHNVLRYLYDNGYRFFQKRKSLVLIISLISSISAIIILFTIEYSVFPKINQTEMVLDIDWNKNITVKENQERIEKILGNSPLIEECFAMIGEQQFLFQNENTNGSSEAKVYIKTATTKEISILKQLIIKNAQSVYPEGSIKFKPPNNIFEYVFGSTKNKVIVEVRANNSVESPPVKKLPEIFRMFNGRAKPNIPIRQTASIRFLHERMLIHNVDYENIKSELKSVFNENTFDYLRLNSKQIPIKLDYKPESFDYIINRLLIKNSEGLYIPIKNLIKITDFEEYKKITSNRRGEFLFFKIDSSENISRDIDNIKKAFVPNKDFNVQFSGFWFELIQLKKNLLLVFLISIFLLYFIMAAQFESTIQPLIVLSEIPIAVGGSLILLWIFGESLNIMSIIGIIVMAGVVINDSILKIHTINLKLKSGQNLKKAIRTAGELRFKAILMTSLTTILALFPFFFINGLGADLQKPFALAVIGGMVLGTFSSLYFIPVIYLRIYKNVTNQSAI